MPHSNGDEEKAVQAVEHIDQKFGTSMNDPEKPVLVELDRFGAHAKVDPKEIALVKKLDLYIMVCLDLLSLVVDFRCALSYKQKLINCPANIVDHVFPQFSRSKRHGQREAQRPHKRFASQGNAVQYTCFHLVRGISLRPSPVEHGTQ